MEKMKQKSNQPLLDRLGEIDKSEDVLLDVLVDGGDSPVHKRKREKLLEERVRIQETIVASGGEVQPMSIEEATNDLIANLMSFTDDLRQLVQFHYHHWTGSGSN